MDRKTSDKTLKEDKAGKETSKEEQIGFHKGALQTLAKERTEFLRILGIVEQLMQLHLKELSDLGVDLQKEVDRAKKEGTTESKKKPPIEDLI
jgi:hypothetical protein